nr:MAG TPA: hypothetical protein [Caudoviricetes sp.]
MERASRYILGRNKRVKAMANRRDNLLYKLRKKGVRVLTRERTIFFAFDREPFDVVQVKRLCREYHFNVQLELQ